MVVTGDTFKKSRGLGQRHARRSLVNFIHVWGVAFQQIKALHRQTFHCVLITRVARLRVHVMCAV